MYSLSLSLSLSKQCLLVCLSLIVTYTQLPFSVTSASVWVNLPAAASLIILLRYFSLDYEMRKKAAVYNNKPASTTSSTLSQNKSLEFTRVVEKSDWRRKVNSPVVEDAIDHFTRRLVSEWVTDLWYSRLTPDKEGPEELVQIMNGVLGEFSSRMRNVNLIDLLTRLQFFFSTLFSYLSSRFFALSLIISGDTGILLISSAPTWSFFVPFKQRWKSDSLVCLPLNSETRN